MRAMPINADCAESGLAHIKRSFKKNWIHYLQEAFGLALFMASACFFGALLWGKDANFHLAVSSNTLRSILTGILMGLTALFIFLFAFNKSFRFPHQPGGYVDLSAIEENR